MKAKFIIVLLSVFMMANGQDWCNMQGCTANTHIACNHDGNFASTCDSPRMITLSNADKQHILDSHNERRNQVASGQLSPFLPAKRMAKLRWSDQMATLAELNTKQCAMKHDACRNTPSFRWSGQNLAMVGTTATYTAEAVIDKSVDMWFSEYSNANMDVINYYSSSSGPTFGHFTAMVTDRSTEIGCGISTYKVSSGGNVFNYYLLACNYASTNMLNCPVYRSGTSASDCTLGRDSTFPGLCTDSEPIDANALLNCKS